MFDESEFSENDRKKTALCPGKTNGVALSDAVGKPCALRFAPFALHLSPCALPPAPCALRPAPRFFDTFAPKRLLESICRWNHLKY
jgi:hypothetical protein